MGIALMLAASALPGCSDTAGVASEREAPARAVLLEALAGDSVLAVVPVTARVESEAGNSVSGALVHWGVVSGGGWLVPEASTSDGSGRISTDWQLGAVAGAQRLHAWWEDPETGDSVVLGTFEVEAAAGTPVALTPGYDTTLVVGEAAALRVTGRDAHGNVLDGSAVGATWATSDPDVVAVSAEGVVTARGGGRAAVQASIAGGEAPAVYQVAVVPSGMESWPLDRAPEVMAFAAGALYLAGPGGPLMRAGETGPDTVASLGYAIEAIVDDGAGAAWVSATGTDPEVVEAFGVFRSADGGAVWTEVPGPGAGALRPLYSPFLGASMTGRPLLKTQGALTTSVDIHRWTGSEWATLGFPAAVNDSACQIMPMVELGGDTVLAGGFVGQPYGNIGPGRPYLAIHVAGSWTELDLGPWASASRTVYRMARRGPTTLMLLYPARDGDPAPLLAYSAAGIEEVDYPFSRVGLRSLAAAGDAACVASYEYAACTRDGVTWRRFDAPAGAGITAIAPDDAGNVWMGIVWHSQEGRGELLRINAGEDAS